MSVMSAIKKIADWIAGGIVGSAAYGVTIVVIPLVIGKINGSLAVISKFASEHPWDVAAWSAVILIVGASVGAIARHRVALRQLAAKDAEIESLKKAKRKHAALFEEFKRLIPAEQQAVVNVYLSEPAGIVPSESQRKCMDNGVRIKRFLCHDKTSDRLHLKGDDVREMLLENPHHVYNLMAARVEEIEGKLGTLPTREELDAANEMAAELQARLGRHESEYDYARLSDAQLRLVRHVWHTESTRGGIAKCWPDDQDATRLCDLGVLEMPDAEPDGNGQVPVTMTPEWRRYVGEHQGQLDAAIRDDEPKW